MKRSRILPFLFVVVLLLAGCGLTPVASVGQPTPTEDCGCSAEGPLKSTLSGETLQPSSPQSAETEAPVETPFEAQVASGSNWVTYSNDAYGFSFEYPSAYASGSYGICAPHQAAELPGSALLQIILGSRTTLTLTPAPQDLETALAAFRADTTSQQLSFEAPQERSVAGFPALALPYRSGGTNRFGESTFFIHNGILYRVDLGGLSVCDIDTLHLRELDAAAHLLKSFAFR